jgi:hypothetical protein
MQEQRKDETPIYPANIAGICEIKITMSEPAQTVIV